MDDRAETLEKHAALVHAGPWAELNRYELVRPDTGRHVRGKVFHKQALGLSGMDDCFKRIPPGASLPFTQRHKQNEEIYVFVAGEEEIRRGGLTAPVREGTLVRFAPEMRTLRNTGAASLTRLRFQAREGSPEDGELGPPAPERAR